MPAPLMWVEERKPETVRHVCLNMRQADAEEIFATSWHDDKERFAQEVMGWQTPFAWVLGAEEPIAIIGAVQMWPRFWSVFCLATDKIKQIGLPLSWFAAKIMIPAIREAGVNRGEAVSLSTHHEAHRWMEALGGTREAVLKGYGKNGEDFVVYRWS
jgi:hypothetical protein